MSFTVTFDLDGKATLTSGDLVQTVASGDSATAPVISAKAGFVFVEWSEDFTNITADLTVEAVYKADPNVFALCEFIAENLLLDADFLAFCAAEFSANPKIFVGFDTNKLPAASQNPFVVISPSSSQNQETTHLQQGIFIAAVCRDSTKTESTSITKHEGYRTIADFESALFQAVERILSEQNNFYSMLSWGSVQYECYYPEFHAARDLTISSNF